jgi:excinuclease UvrABC nuclease subunit
MKTEDNWENMKHFNIRQLKNATEEACVYFLFNDIELVYIGMTSNLKKRIQNHIIHLNTTIITGNERLTPPEFDNVYYLLEERYKKLIELELIYQRKYRPKLN